MTGVIPPGASIRAHVVEVLTEAGTWAVYARCGDRGEAERVARPLTLHLPPERLRLRPTNPSNVADLHGDDRLALVFAVRRGVVTPNALARALGGAARQVVKIRASRALRRLRDADLLAAVPNSVNGQHRATDRGRALAQILDEGKSA